MPGHRLAVPTLLTLPTILATVLTVLATVLLVAGCGDTQEDPRAASMACEVKVAGAAAQRPTVEVPDCPPPVKLVSRDLHAGSGPRIRAGQTAVVHYVAVAWSTRRAFGASWDRRRPLRIFDVGHAAVMAGWNEGLVGMREGGRRLLVIPPAKARGDRPEPAPSPNETVVFVVDLIGIEAGRLR